MDLPVALMADSVGEGNIYFFTEECPIGVAGHMELVAKGVKLSTIVPENIKNLF